MEHLDSVPHFVEPGDAQDKVLALPIFVTRSADEATRKQHLAALAADMERRKATLQNGPVKVKQRAKPCSATDCG